MAEDPAEEVFVPSGRSGNNNKIIQAALIGLSVCFIAVQLFLYSNPAQPEQDAATLARQQAIGSLVQCLLVFREIGLILQDGRMPDNTMICADSPVPNVVNNENGIVRISHPNPQFYGYSEISVSDETPEPNIIRAE